MAEQLKYFDIFSDDLDEHLSEMNEINRRETKRWQEFKSKFNKIIDKYPVNNTRQQHIQQSQMLAKFLFEDNKFENLNQRELITALRQLREIGHYQDMIVLYESAKNTDFKSNFLVRENMVVAYNQSFMQKNAISMVEGLIEDGHENGRVYNALGEIYSSMADIARSYIEGNLTEGLYHLTFSPNVSNPKPINKDDVKYILNSAESLAKDVFKKSFEKYMDITSCTNLMLLEAQTGRLDVAKRMAKIVHMLADRDGGMETKNFYTSKSLFLASIFLGLGQEEIGIKINLMEENRRPHWEYKKTIEQIEKIKAGVKTFEGFESIQKAIEYSIKILSGPTKEIKVLKTQDELEPVELFYNKTYDYRGMNSSNSGASYVTGNIQNHGKLSDHSITRSDWSQFEKLIHTQISQLLTEVEAKLPETVKTLADISDEDMFLDVANKMVRQWYGTMEKNLEDSSSVGKKMFDNTVTAINKFSGIINNKGSDSRTNISVSTALGLGDCRHHAQTLQLMFDVWQKEKMDENIRDAYWADKSDDKILYGMALRDFESHVSRSLRTSDLTVKAAVKVSKKYEPLKLDDKFVQTSDGSIHEIEDHTMNIMFEKDRNGKILNIKKKDSFYHNTYKFDSGNIDINDINLDKTNNSINLEIGKLTVISGDELPIIVTPAPYAGRREKLPLDELGVMLLTGRDIGNFDLVEILTDPNKKRSKNLEIIYEWGIQQHFYNKTSKDYVLKASGKIVLDTGDFSRAYENGAINMVPAKVRPGAARFLIPVPEIPVGTKDLEYLGDEMLTIDWKTNTKKQNKEIGREYGIKWYNPYDKSQQVVAANGREYIVVANLDDEHAKKLEIFVKKQTSYSKKNIVEQYKRIIEEAKKLQRDQGVKEDIFRTDRDFLFPLDEQTNQMLPKPFTTSKENQKYGFGQHYKAERNLLACIIKDVPITSATTTHKPDEYNRRVVTYNELAPQKDRWGYPTSEVFVNSHTKSDGSKYSIDNLENELPILDVQKILDNNAITEANLAKIKISNVESVYGWGKRNTPPAITSFIKLNQVTSNIWQKY